MEVKSHQPRINMNQPPGLWPVLLGAEGGGGAACSCFKRLAFRGCAIGHWGLSKDIAWIWPWMLPRKQGYHTYNPYNYVVI